MLIPAWEWHHPIDITTCDFCYDLIGAYEGIVVPMGSQAAAEIAGPFHPNCKWARWIFRLVPPSLFGKPVKGIIDALPAESKTWGIASKSIWPIAVFAAMIDKAKDKEVKLPDMSYQDIEFSPSLIEDAAAYIRKVLRKGEKTLDYIKEYVYNKYGINGSIAIEEAGI